MIKVGLVGCGAVVHRMYTKGLLGRSAYRVAFVSDLDPAQAASAAEVFDAQAVDLDVLVDQADAIVVSPPPATHAALVRACLRPGRTVLCEKPYMTSGVDAAAVAREASEVGASLYVGHFRRAFPHLALAQRLIGLGLIGDITGVSACEGGRFTWRTVSDYPVRDIHGGVLWDTGSHTLDMALFASGLDRVAPDFAIEVLRVDKDKSEPSHDFLADFRLEIAGRPVDGHVHVSRKQSLPNLIEIAGTRGKVSFSAGLDDRIRITTEAGSEIVKAERAFEDLMEGFDLQLRHVLLKDRDGDFAADRFIGQVRLMEALANA